MAQMGGRTGRYSLLNVGPPRDNRAIVIVSLGTTCIYLRGWLSEKQQCSRMSVDQQCGGE